MLGKKGEIMKFIHCADLHLESRIDSLPLAQAQVRREEIISSFERLVDYATKTGVKAIIISGDMFDTKKVTLRTKNRINHIIAKNNSVDFLYLAGNHDEQTYFFDEQQKPVNFHFFGDDWTSFRYGNVNIVGAILQPSNVDVLPEKLVLSDEDINVVVLHGQIAGYVSREKAQIISLPRYKDKNIDYMALGHIHSFSEGKLDNRGTYAYSGCLDARGFDETGEKGFVLIETEKNSLNYNFVAFSSRKFYEIKVDVTEFDDYFTLRDAVNEALKQNCDSSSLIKLVLEGERSIDFDINVDGLTKYFLNSFFYCKVIDKTSLKINEIDYQLDKTVRGEFMREVLAQNISDELKTEILTCGLRALKGEDL